MSDVVDINDYWACKFCKKPNHYTRLTCRKCQAPKED